MIFKQVVSWNQVTEKLPEEGREYLVWTGNYMIVSDVRFYTAEDLKIFEEIVSKEHAASCARSKGYFEEFGQKYSFDDQKVYWAELPLAPGEQNPPPPDPFEGMVSKDVYLKKDGKIVGIHAIGYPGPYEYQLHELDGTISKKTVDFMQAEIWGNEYDDEHNMLGRGSFRVFDELENEVKNWEADGWVQYEGPRKKP